jgi:hypothetical protein
MGYQNKSLAPFQADSAIAHRSIVRGKISLLKTVKSNLVKVTVEVNNLRPSVYKYLLP